MNATRTKVMTCIPGRSREGYTEEEYTQHRTGMETATDRECHLVDCQICGVSLQASLGGHLKTQHDVHCLFSLNRNIIVNHPVIVHHAIASTNTGCYFCLVVNCVGGVSTWWNLRHHFLEYYPPDLVICPSEGSAPLLKCTRCGMQMAAGALLHNHQKTELCMERWRQQVQHETAAAAQLSLEMRFFGYREELEWVKVFKYLGRLLSYDDNDTHAMRANLTKASRCWTQVSQVLRSESALPKVCGVFTKQQFKQCCFWGVRCGIWCHPVWLVWKAFA
jgi:hypothetical protein